MTTVIQASMVADDVATQAELDAMNLQFVALAEAVVLKPRTT